MKITLVQSEIEEAIQQYLAARMTIAEGMVMKIELFSTRGDTGFTSLIDVKPGQVTPSGKTEAQAASNASTAQAAPTQANTRHKPAYVEEAPVSEDGPDESAEGDIGESVEAAPEEPPFDTASLQPNEAPHTAPVAAEQPKTDVGDAPKSGRGGRSLFGGLKKPTNTPTPH